MKKLLAMILAAAMLLTFAACGAATEQEEPASTPTGTTGLKSITVTVVHSDGSTKTLTYETAEEFLGPVLKDAGLIRGNDGPYGLEITEVDEETAIYNTDKAYWALYEGDTYAMQGIDQTPVVDGGTYKLEYTGA